MPFRLVAVVLCCLAGATLAQPLTVSDASSPGLACAPDLVLRPQEEEERRHQELLQKKKEEEEEQERLRKAAEAKRLAERREQERLQAER